MKIGIISMQRVINYGSFLQAYALKTLLEGMGNQVCFVDIKPGIQVVEKDKPKTPVGIDRFIFKRIHHVFFRRRREKLFYEKLFPLIGISSPIAEADCDMLVIGSDEVFNCMNPSKWGFSTQLFGDVAKAAISYAASCGYTTYKDAERMGIQEKIEYSLQKLKAISVRDENTYVFVERLSGIAPIRHLDPVLIYPWNKEVELQKRYQNYILVYGYDNRINNPAEIRAIRTFAKVHGKKLISFGVYQRWCDKNVLCTPFELLSYFAGADYVVTDTFHGTVLSIRFNKQFATIIRDSNRNKLHDLLSRFRLENREVTNLDTLDSILTEKISYLKINEQLKSELVRSINYLQSNLIDNKQEA